MALCWEIAGPPGGVRGFGDRGQGEHRAGGEAEGAAAAQLLLLHGETNGAQQTAAQARAKPRCCPAPGPRARPGRGGPAQRDGVVSERSS